MNVSTTICVLLCTVLVASHSSPAIASVANEKQDLTQQLPAELWHEVLSYVSLSDYLSVLQACKGTRKSPPLPFKTELEMRRRHFIGKLFAHLARTYLGWWSTPARVKEAERGMVYTTSEELLKELMDAVFAELERLKNRQNIFDCCKILAADKRLDVKMWRAYADAAMGDVINGVVAKKTITARLENLLIMAANVDSMDVITAIVSSSEEAHVQIDLAVDSNCMIRGASVGGHVKVVEYLLAKKEEQPELYGGIDPASYGNYAVKWASERGHVEVVRLLLAKKEERPELYGSIDPAACGNCAIREAAEHGYVEVVRLLLAKKEEKPELYGNIDPATCDNCAIIWAIVYGHVKVVELLLAKKEERPELYGNLDPAACDNYAIRWAVIHGHDQVVALLLKKREEHPELYGDMDHTIADGSNILVSLEKGFYALSSCPYADKKGLVNSMTEAAFCTIM